MSARVFRIFSLVFLLAGCSGGTMQPPAAPVAAPGVGTAPKINGTVFGVSPAADTSADGARFNYPEDTAEAADGTIYISDTQSHVIKRLKDGVVSVFAGTFVAGYNGDGARLTTQLNLPTALQLSMDGKFLLFSDPGNNLLRKINLGTGAITSFAGKAGENSMPTDGAAALGSPIGYVAAMHLDTYGNLWFPTTAETATATDGGVFYIDSAGVLHRKIIVGAGSLARIRDIFLGTGYIDFTRDDDFIRAFDDGTVKQAKLTSGNGKGIVATATGTLVGSHTSLLLFDDNLKSTVVGSSFANISNIRKATQGYLITDSDQGALFRYNDDGTKTQLTGIAPASLGALISVVKYTDTSVLILDNQRPRIFLLDLTTGNSTLWAGTGQQGWATINVDKLNTTFYYPNGIAVDAAKNVYVIEQNRILKIAASGQVAVFAGNEIAGDQDGSYSDARFRSPGGIAVDDSGNVIVADTYNNKIRKVTASGVVTTIAGTGAIDLPTFLVPATQSALNRPQGLLALPDGRLLIADAWNNAVYTLAADGMLRPFAGRPNRTGYQGYGTFTGDGGPAVEAGMNTPSSLALGTDGSIYISDQFNHRIRRVSASDRTISTIAGSSQGFAPEGKLLNFPAGILELQDQLFVADTGNRIIVRYFLK